MQEILELPWFTKSQRGVRGWTGLLNPTTLRLHTMATCNNIDLTFQPKNEHFCLPVARAAATRAAQLPLEPSECQAHFRQQQFNKGTQQLGIAGRLQVGNIY